MRSMSEAAEGSAVGVVRATTPKVLLCSVSTPGHDEIARMKVEQRYQRFSDSVAVS
jgi:hypothetical protein